jgi:hypothetical protein
VTESQQQQQQHQQIGRCQGPSRHSPVQTRAQRRFPFGQVNLQSLRRRRGDYGRSHERSDGQGVCCGQEDLYGRLDDCDPIPASRPSPPSPVPFNSTTRLLWDSNNAAVNETFLLRTDENHPSFRNESATISRRVHPAKSQREITPTRSLEKRTINPLLAAAALLISMFAVAVGFLVLKPCGPQIWSRPMFFGRLTSHFFLPTPRASPFFLKPERT